MKPHGLYLVVFLGIGWGEHSLTKTFEDLCLKRGLDISPVQDALQALSFTLIHSHLMTTLGLGCIPRARAEALSTLGASPKSSLVDSSNATQNRSSCSQMEERACIGALSLPGSLAAVTLLRERSWETN